MHEAAPGELCELCAPADDPRAAPPPRARKLAFGSEAVAPPPFADVTNLRLPPLPPQKAAADDASLEEGFMSLDDILDASAVYHLPADFLGGVGDGADDEYCALVGADGGHLVSENYRERQRGRGSGRNERERDKAGRTAAPRERRERTGHCGVPGAPPPCRWLIDGA